MAAPNGRWAMSDTIDSACDPGVGRPVATGHGTYTTAYRLSCICRLPGLMGCMMH
jgi:hypothetical protein